MSTVSNFGYQVSGTSALELREGRDARCGKEFLARRGQTALRDELECYGELSSRNAPLVLSGFWQIVAWAASQILLAEDDMRGDAALGSEESCRGLALGVLACTLIMLAFIVLPSLL